MLFSVDVFTVLFLCFSDCHDSTCAFLIVMLILIYALFNRLVIILVCVKCFNIDVRIYGTLLLPPFFFFFFFLSLIRLFCHFDIDVCIYSTCTFVVVGVYCQAEFDVDNVQRRELVNFYGT